MNNRWQQYTLSNESISNMINFLMIVNKRGQPRIRKYYVKSPKEEKTHEAEIIKKCIYRDDKQCSFFDCCNDRIVYRKYGALFVIVGTTEDENELAIWEFIRNIMETLNEYFKRVTEIDIMLNVDHVYIILEEMIANGHIRESARSRILSPVYVMDKALKK